MNVRKRLSSGKAELNEIIGVIFMSVTAIKNAAKKY
jgi:hypothetical protein